MSLSAKALASIQNEYKNMPKSKTDTKNTNISIAKKKKNDENIDSSGPKMYILEGGIIKVYITDENGVLKCVKQMPLEAAPLSVLLEVKPSSLSDAIMLREAIDAKLQDNSITSNYDNTGSTPEFNDN